ncbi:hypothetical protein MPTK2_Ug00264 [Marchantia polymorpha subsp. ruderalis]
MHFLTVISHAGTERIWWKPHPTRTGRMWKVSDCVRLSKIPREGLDSCWGEYCSRRKRTPEFQHGVAPAGGTGHASLRLWQRKLWKASEISLLEKFVNPYLTRRSHHHRKSPILKNLHQVRRGLTAPVPTSHLLRRRAQMEMVEDGPIQL